ncbi:MAG: hypothetical protein EZS28_004995 [Streblomastix strix]|uniref:Uncharacterized protein n=1 Tax=Streblomastix strix TaxID=222440 RepID=A0A5J4WWR4_9EUKA|nr:MAG: hypothetical protein EZS28_004995 [Streblomastix strix]
MQQKLNKDIGIVEKEFSDQANRELYSNINQIESKSERKLINILNLIRALASYSQTSSSQSGQSGNPDANSSSLSTFPPSLLTFSFQLMFFTQKSGYKWMDLFILEDTIGEAVQPCSSHSYMQKSSYSFQSSLSQSSSSSLAFLPSLPLSDLLFIFTVDYAEINESDVIQLIEQFRPHKKMKSILKKQRKALNKRRKKAQIEMEENRYNQQFVDVKKQQKQRYASEMQEQQQQIMKFAQKKIKIIVWYSPNAERDGKAKIGLQILAQIEKKEEKKDLDVFEQMKEKVKEILIEKLKKTKISQFRADMYIRERIAFSILVERYMKIFFENKMNNGPDISQLQQFSGSDLLQNVNILQILINAILSTRQNIRRNALITLLALIPSPSAYSSLSPNSIYSNQFSINSSSQSHSFSNLTSSSFNTRNLLCIILEEIINTNILSLIRMILINSQDPNDDINDGSDPEFERDRNERQREAQICMEIIKKIFDIMEYIGDGFIDFSDSIDQRRNEQLLEAEPDISSNEIQLSLQGDESFKTQFGALHPIQQYEIQHSFSPSLISHNPIKFKPTSIAVSTFISAYGTNNEKQQQQKQHEYITMSEYCTSLFNRILTPLHATPLFIHIISLYSTQSNCGILCSLINRSSTDTLKVLIQTVVPYALLGAIHAQKREVVVSALIRMLKIVKKQQKLEWVYEAQKKLIRLSSDSSV